jgi:hypothetical protein
MAADPPDIDPADQDPQERGLERRSGETGLGLWAALALIAMLVAAIWVIWSISG